MTTKKPADMSDAELAAATMAAAAEARTLASALRAALAEAHARGLAGPPPDEDDPDGIVEQAEELLARHGRR